MHLCGGLDHPIYLWLGVSDRAIRMMAVGRAGMRHAYSACMNTCTQPELYRDTPPIKLYYYFLSWKSKWFCTPIATIRIRHRTLRYQSACWKKSTFGRTLSAPPILQLHLRIYIYASCLHWFAVHDKAMESTVGCVSLAYFFILCKLILA